MLKCSADAKHETNSKGVCHMFENYDIFFSNVGMLTFLVGFCALFFGHIWPTMVMAVVMIIGDLIGYSVYGSLVFIGMAGAVWLIIGGILGFFQEQSSGMPSPLEEFKPQESCHEKSECAEDSCEKCA